jgi:hypothetical protein
MRGYLPKKVLLGAILAGVLVLAAPGAHAAISASGIKNVIAQGDGHVDGSGNAQIDFTIPTSTCANNVLVVNDYGQFAAASQAYDGNGNFLTSSTVLFNGNNVYTSMWWLPGLPDGYTHVSFIHNGGGNSYDAYALYCGVDQTTPIENYSATVNGSAATYTNNVTTLSSNAWIVAAVQVESQSISFSAPTNTQDGETSCSRSMALLGTDNNPILTPGAAGITYSSCGAAAISPAIVASLKPSGGVFPSSIDLTRPANGTTTADFSNTFWAGTVTGGGATTTNAFFEVNYCLLDNGCLAYLLDTSPNFFLVSSTSNWALDKGVSLDNGTWQTYVTLRNANNPASILAQSPTSTFTIVGSFGNTSTTQNFTGSCNFTSSSFFGDPIGNIQQGICNALTFLFVLSPVQHSDINNRFSTFKYGVVNKPPFGYLIIAKNEFAALTPSTSSASSTLLNASGTAALHLVFGPLDLGLASIIFFLLLLWIFHRGRHLDI